MASCYRINLSVPIATSIPAPSVETKPSSNSNNVLLDFIQSVIVSKQETKEPFYVLDLEALASLMDRWTRNLPTVRPFYAVKSNPDPLVLRTMAELGSGFDCATRAEIEAVLSLGVSPDRIIFASPCKLESHVTYAANVGVNLTTFDSESEIPKIQKHHPNCELLIRIKSPDDAGAIFPMDKKYGALPEEVEPLLRAAQAAKLRVVGVSFHIGSGAKRVDAYRSAIQAARKAFDVAASIGMPKMRLLNVGGGFMAEEQFETAADIINSAMTEYFKDEPEITFIAEPGRFFSETIFTLAVNIFGKRQRGELRQYWINDGIYGSLNSVLYGDPINDPTPFACTSRPGNPTCRGEKAYTSMVFGPTCAGCDTVFTDHQLPDLQINDWLIFPNMGAYAKVCGSNFNGFNTASISTYLANAN